MYRYSQHVRQNFTNIKVRIRVLTILLIIMTVLCLFFGVRYFKEDGRSAQTQQLLIQRVRACCMEGKSIADKIPSSVHSSTSVQLSNVQKCVYAIQELNNLSISLYGESGRIVPQISIDALNEDLATCYATIQSAGEGIDEKLYTLRNHLLALQTILLQDEGA